MARQEKEPRAAGAGRRVVTRARKRQPKHSEGPSAIDIHVGAQVRARRTALGLSQDKLGAAVGLTFQQIQKYERGANRIGASRLYEFSTVLGVPIGYFYEAVPAAAVAAVQERLADDVSLSDLGPETLRMVGLYYRIARVDVRRRLYELVKAVAQEGRAPNSG